MDEWLARFLFRKKKELHYIIKSNACTQTSNHKFIQKDHFLGFSSGANPQAVMMSADKVSFEMVPMVCGWAEVWGISVCHTHVWGGRWGPQKFQ